jgi:hypothetical protein
VNILSQQGANVFLGAARTADATLLSWLFKQQMMMVAVASALLASVFLAVVSLSFFKYFLLYFAQAKLGNKGVFVSQRLSVLGFSFPT